MNDSIHRIEVASAAPSRIESKKEEMPLPSAVVSETDEAKRWLLIHLQILQKILNLFPKESSEDVAISLIRNLKQFKNYLYELTLQDLSHDTAFLLQLSESWHKFMEYFSFLDIETNSEESRAIKEFVSEIHDYPFDQKFSLGYYLSENAGENWIPFPFMNLLQNLYQEHQKDPNQSLLSHWLASLDRLLQ